jgi:trafficking protein particle complex subunit 2
VDSWANVSHLVSLGSSSHSSSPGTSGLSLHLWNYSLIQLCVSRYLKCIDKFFSNYISCLITAGNIKFLLLHQPSTAVSTASSRSSTSIGANPTSPQTEEAIKNFFVEVYENYVKAIMSPFYRVNMEIQSPMFRSRVAAAGRKYL